MDRNYTSPPQLELPPPPPLPEGFQLREVERFDEPRFTELVEEVLLGWSAHLPLGDFLSPEEREAREPLRKQQDVRRVGIYREDELVAWTVGWRQGEERFYMALSGVVPDHRRKGLYRLLVEDTLRWARERGYAEVWSRHLASNNPVLVAKLQLGFRLTGLEVSPSMGILVQLRFPLDPVRELALRVRTGSARAPALLQSYLCEEPSGRGSP